MQDNEIIALFLQRDEKALSELCSKYGKNLLGIALNMLGSKEDAEECVNDAYLAVWNKIPPERPASLFAYVSKILRNTALTRLRDDGAKKRGKDVTVCLDELDEILPDSESVFDRHFCAEREADPVGVFVDGDGEVGGVERLAFNIDRASFGNFNHVHLRQIQSIQRSSPT